MPRERVTFTWFYCIVKYIYRVLLENDLRTHRRDNRDNYHFVVVIEHLEKFRKIHVMTRVIKKWFLIKLL